MIKIKKIRYEKDLLILIFTKYFIIYQWQVGGTSLFNSSKDFSERYSCTNATVTTIMIA